MIDRSMMTCGDPGTESTGALDAHDGAEALVVLRDGHREGELGLRNGLQARAKPRKAGRNPSEEGIVSTRILGKIMRDTVRNKERWKGAFWNPSEPARKKIEPAFGANL